MTETTRPRGVLSLFFRRGGSGLIFPLIFAGFAGVFGSLSLQDATDFASRAQTVTAEIVSTQLKTSRSSGTNWEVQEATVRFMVDGEEIFASARVGDDVFDNARVGDSVDIRYLPENPRQIEIERGVNLKFTLILATVVAAALGTWLFAIARAVRFARQGVRVRIHGARSLVPVTEHKDPLFSGNKNPKTCLVWRDSAGRECRSLPIPQDRADSFSVGTQIAIYELPKADLDSFWEGDVGHA